MKSRGNMQLRDYQLAGVNEISAAFSAGIRRVCYVAPCGAGKSEMIAYMANKAADKENQVLFLIHRRELLEQVQETIGRTSPLITMGTVQALLRKLDKLPAPKLIISDEFHHGTAATWRKIFDYFPDAFIVGLTATPARMGGQGLSDICDRLIIGPTTAELIGRGYLAKFKYYAPPIPVDFEDVKMIAGDYDNREITIRIDKPHITGQAIEHYQLLAAGKQAIIYCASLEHSRHTVSQFQEAGINAQHVDGETPKETRTQAIEDFKAGRLTVLSNVELFGEGLNIPGVEVVLLLRPTQSLTLHLQQSMRSMRPGPNKTAIIIDAVGNVYRHGLPDAPREWSLDGHQRRKNAPGGVGIRYCPMCYGVLNPAPICPYCGYQFTVTQRMLAVENGALAEFDAEQAARAAKVARMEVGQCRTMEDLKRIETERGYQKGWAWRMAKIKKIGR